VPAARKPRTAIAGLSEAEPCRPDAWHRVERFPVSPAIDRSPSAQPELSRIGDRSRAVNVVESEVETERRERVRDPAE
jgi:hypothetical protein